MTPSPWPRSLMLAASRGRWRRCIRPEHILLLSEQAVENETESTLVTFSSEAMLWWAWNPGSKAISLCSMRANWVDWASRDTWENILAGLSERDVTWGCSLRDVTFEISWKTYQKMSCAKIRDPRFVSRIDYDRPQDSGAVQPLLPEFANGKWRPWNQVDFRSLRCGRANCAVPSRPASGIFLDGFKLGISVIRREHF